MSNPLDQPEIPTPVPPSTATPAAASVSQQDHQSDERQPLAIEYNNPSKEEEVQTLDLGEGNVIKLDKLGPMIINNDWVSDVALRDLGVRIPVLMHYFRLCRGSKIGKISIPLSKRGL